MNVIPSLEQVKMIDKFLFLFLQLIHFILRVRIRFSRRKNFFLNPTTINKKNKEERGEKRECLDRLILEAKSKEFLLEVFEFGLVGLMEGLEVRDTLGQSQRLLFFRCQLPSYVSVFFVLARQSTISLFQKNRK